ncbi:20982_t:CDS:2 [Entrophospora sp. SA101]|nr:20982_t:CDS:2 [Entrophospora sp. SA101]
MPRKSPITRKILITVVFLTLAVASSWIIIHHSRKTEEPKKIELKANNNQNQENNQVPDDFPQSNENSEQNPPKIEENKTPKVEEPKGQKEEPKTPPPPSQPNQEEKIRSSKRKRENRLYPDNKIIFIPVNVGSFHHSLLVYKKSDDTFRHYDRSCGTYPPVITSILLKRFKNNGLVNPTDWEISREEFLTERGEIMDLISANE